MEGGVTGEVLNGLIQSIARPSHDGAGHAGGMGAMGGMGFLLILIVLLLGGRGLGGFGGAAPAEAAAATAGFSAGERQMASTATILQAIDTAADRGTTNNNVQFANTNNLIERVSSMSDCMRTQIFGIDKTIACSTDSIKTAVNAGDASILQSLCNGFNNTNTNMFNMQTNIDKGMTTGFTLTAEKLATIICKEDAILQQVACAEGAILQRVSCAEERILQNANCNTDRIIGANALSEKEEIIRDQQQKINELLFNSKCHCNNGGGNGGNGGNNTNIIDINNMNSVMQFMNMFRGLTADSKVNS
jgi:hypothetical protein